MASLKRDTPAGRAALARRRQRAAAVVDHSARFVHPEDEGAICASEDSTQSPLPNEREQPAHPQQHQHVSTPKQHQQAPKQQQQQQQQKQQQHHPPPSGASRPHQRDPPEQQKPQQEVQKQQRSRLKDPPQRTAPSGGTSYSAASLPSSDELLERSSQVAQAAASVLASARKTKTPQRNQAYASTSSNKPSAERERYLGGPPTRKPRPQVQEPIQSESVYETPMQALHNTKRITADAAPAAPATPAARMAAQSHAYAERRQQQHQQQQQSQNRQHQPSQPLPSIQHSRAKSQPVHSEPTNIDESFEDQNHPQMLEEEITMEEREHVISRQDEYEVLDAACLISGSWMMLKSMAASATVASAFSTADESNDNIALVGGTGLGTPEELLQVVKSDGTLSQLGTFQDGPLRWGDAVALLLPGASDYQQPKVLGVRTRTSKQLGSMPTAGRIGWFRLASERVETWTLLRGNYGSNYRIRIGLSASPSAKILAERRAARGEFTRVVQSGDPILLRHDQTGGLLSVNMADGSLELVSDSYDSNRGDAFRSSSRSTSSGLLGQLQRHDRYLPMDQDTFAFIEPCVPPCPRWILGGGTSTSSNQSYNPLGHRMYLHQTYLQQQNRNITRPSMQEKLFGKMWSSLTVTDEQEEARQRMELPDQEKIMLDEVLGACLALEGKQIRANSSEQEHDDDQVSTVAPHNIEFCLREGAELLFDASLRNLAEKILPLGTSYARVSAFVASHLPGYEYGSVMQAFCEAIDGMLQEYGTFVANLEEQFRRPHQSVQDVLTLRRLHAHMMPSLHTMSILEKATFAVRDKTGGALLNSLSTLKSWSCEGDLVANRVLGLLLEKSSIPYMTMLTTWLQDGLLQDPYREFMIEVNDEPAEKKLKHSADSDFNNESYILREEHVLTELMGSEVLLQKVVAAGKYWRAVRACEVALRKKAPIDENENGLRQPTTVLQYSLSFSSTASFIQSMHECASQALVNLLMRDFNLMDALRSMKQYFLLDHGDFFLSFVDAAEEELLKELGDVSAGRIQHMLRTSVSLTNGGEDVRPRHEGAPRGMPTHGPPQRTLSPLALRCRFQHISLINHIDSVSNGRAGQDDSLLNTPSRDAYGMSNKGLTGVETIVLDFLSVPFPISLVLTDSAISSYQLLFRLLFFAKYVERRLLGIWQDHQAMKELNSVRGLFGPTFLLRQRMLHFAQNLIYYFISEVISPNWLEMEKGIGDPAIAGKHTVDDIVDVHEAFLHRTLEACLLTNRELVRTLTKLLTTCLMFADQMKLFTEATRIHDESSHIAAERRKTIQRSLNDRGGGGSKAPVDKTALREAIRSFKLDRQTRLKKQKRRVGRELSSESYRRMVGRFEEVFSAYLSEFMLQLNSDTGTAYQEHKTNLCSRLDYNGFLSSSIVIDKEKG